MNILLLSQFFSTTKGGGEYLFNVIAKKLAENNHKVWVITNKVKEENYMIHENVRIIFVPPTLQYKGGLPPGFSENLRYLFNAVKVGFKIIKNGKIDLIHSNNFTPAVVGSILSFFTLKPHITSVWDIFTLCGKDYWKKWVKQKGVSKIHAFIGPRFEKMILKIRCNAIHTISEATKDDLIKFGAKKPIHIIFPSIIKTDSKKIPQNPVQFVYVGRLVFYKNVEILIRAINLVKSESGVKLIVIGGGPHKETLEKLTKDLKLESNVEFRGYVSTNEKLEIIRQSNALLFPSLCEGFGLVILEAFSQNRPVIVSNIRPMSDIVSHNSTGYVLEPREEVWAEHLLNLIKNPEVSERMGKNGFELLRTKYNQELMYEKIIKMYQETIPSNPPS